MPACSKDGSKPIPTVETPIKNNVRISEYLRPKRSPRLPKMIPPSGLATKPTARVANDESVPTSWLLPGKNTWLKINADAVA
ncbi:hypothetical protein D3C76_652200 [compost metagenome]